MVIEYFLDWVAYAPVAKRVESAGALVRAYLNKEIKQEEREDVEAAITILLEDPSPLVRIAIATGFGARGSAPRHVISALAADVVEVSVIVLSRSSVFHDCELVDFVHKGEIDKQIAISCRPWLSAQVLSAICSSACEEACIGVLANPVADFAYQDLHALAERFGESVDIRNILLERPELAAETKLLLITKLSSSLSAFVSGNKWISNDRAEKAANEASDKAAINFAATISDEDVERVVRSLINEGRMTVSFLLRAVCMGNITLVARAFSQLSNVKFARVEAILTKDRQSAFKAVYDRAGLPKSAFMIFACAISTWRRLLSSGSKINQHRMPFLVTREVLEIYSGNTDEVVDELMILLRRLSAETARESAKSKAVEISQRAPEVVEQFAHIVENSSVEMLEFEPAAQTTTLPIESQTSHLHVDLAIAEILEPEVQKPSSIDARHYIDLYQDDEDEMLEGYNGLFYPAAIKAA